MVLESPVTHAPVWTYNRAGESYMTGFEVYVDGGWTAA